MSTARLGWHGLTRGRYTRTGSGALMKELLGDFDSAMTMSLIRSRIRSGELPVRCSVSYDVRWLEVMGLSISTPEGSMYRGYSSTSLDTGRIRSGALVEGALDAVALSMVGVHGLAIYGSRLTAYQVKLIDRLDPAYVYTAYDQDDAGWKAHCDTERAFPHRAVLASHRPRVHREGHRGAHRRTT